MKTKQTIGFILLFAIMFVLPIPVFKHDNTWDDVYWMYGGYCLVMIGCFALSFLFSWLFETDKTK